MSTTASSGTAASPSPSVFLPRHLVPRRYAVSLAPDLVACTFTGSLSLEAELVEAGHSTVVLHAHQLAVRDVVFTPGAPGSAPVPAVRLAYDVPAQTLTLSFAQPLPAGRGTLACAFAGTLNDELAGFYRSRYAGPDGAPRYAAVTQFEATDARRCFPCLDEPDRKAVFSLTVTAPADRVALSGGAVARVSTSKDGRARTTTFEDTPVQSTYLVALCVGEWDVVSATHGRSGITTNVWTPPGGAAHGEFALKAGVDSLELLSSLFDVPYFGGRKVDHVALKDFAAGAMENTGCITYREAALLIDASGSSLAMRQRVAQVVAHELSHQFFGNLVTMKWWDGLCEWWLSAGSAL